MSQYEAVEGDAVAWYRKMSAVQQLTSTCSTVFVVHHTHFLHTPDIPDMSTDDEILDILLGHSIYWRALWDLCPLTSALL